MTKSTPTIHCPECGGQFTAEETCTDRYHACLALEYPDPAYGQVHHFTVLAYMLQHPSQLSADGWLAMHQLLGQFLVDDISPARMRQLLQQPMQNKSFSMVKGAPAAQPDWNWTKTIMDVRLDDPTTYCADVRAWAEAVHHDIQQKETL
jgi:hypothetical protein